MNEKKTIQPFSWSAPEYSAIPRSIDWFWGIGLLAIVGAGVAVYFHNYLFAVFILISGFMLILLNIHTPREITFEINQKGISVAGTLYEYKNIKGFTVLEKDKPVLMIETSKYFLPVLTIPLPEYQEKTVRATLSDIVPELELPESRTLMLIEKFKL